MRDPDDLLAEVLAATESADAAGREAEFMAETDELRLAQETSAAPSLVGSARVRNVEGSRRPPPMDDPQTDDEWAYSVMRDAYVLGREGHDWERARLHLDLDGFYGDGGNALFGNGFSDIEAAWKAGRDNRPFSMKLWHGPQADDSEEEPDDGR